MTKSSRGGSDILISLTACTRMAFSILFVNVMCTGKREGIPGFSSRKESISSLYPVRMQTNSLPKSLRDLAKEYLFMLIMNQSFLNLNGVGKILSEDQNSMRIALMSFWTCIRTNSCRFMKWAKKLVLIGG